MVLLPPSIRVAAKCLMVQRTRPIMHVRHRDREHHWQRDFSQSAPQHAQEDPQNIVVQLQSSPLMKEIIEFRQEQEHSEVLAY